MEIDEQIIPIKSFDFICRICLLYKETGYFPIKDVSWENIDLKHVLFLCASIEVNDYNGLPQNICQDCIKKVYYVYNFLTTCKRSESTLKYNLSKKFVENIIIKNEEPFLAADDSYDIHDNLELTLSNNDLDVKESELIIDQKNLEKPVIQNGFNKNQTLCNLSKNFIENIIIKKEVNDSYDVHDNSELISSNNKPLDLKETDLINDQEKLTQNLQISVIQIPKQGNKLGPPFICITCDASFEHYQDWKNHKIETKHNSAKKYACTYCPRKDMTRPMLEEHVRTHTGEKPHKCKVCEKAFNNRNNLNRHMNVHLKVKPFACQFCSKGFTRKQYLKEHERIHTGEKTLICSFCGKASHSYAALYVHEKTHKNISSVPSKIKFTCKVCNETFVTEQRLDVHMKYIHPVHFNMENPNNSENLQEKDTKLKCSFCEDTFKSYESLCSHERQHDVSTDHTDELTKTENKFQCHICDKILTCENNLSQHMLLHGPRNFNCEICGKAFIHEKRLMGHMEVVHQGHRFPCTECEKVYKQKGDLVSHMKRRHRGENFYPCEYCDKVFACSRSRSHHIRKHKGDTTYQCKVCMQICTTKGGMDSHMRIHSDEKPFSCEYCGKTFTFKSNLSSHIKIHLGVKSHHCKECGKGFYYGRSLRKHLLVHEKSRVSDKLVE